MVGSILGYAILNLWLGVSIGYAIRQLRLGVSIGYAIRQLWLGVWATARWTMGYTAIRQLWLGVSRLLHDGAWATAIRQLWLGVSIGLRSRLGLILGYYYKYGASNTEAEMSPFVSADDLAQRKPALICTSGCRACAGRNTPFDRVSRGCSEGRD